jgi:peptidyl-prolyl cis-trans isomerase D
MLAAIRAFAKSWVASLLIGLLVVSFSVWGIRDVLHPKFSDAVVTAGSHQTSPAAFKREFDILRQQWSQQNNQDMSVQDAVASGFDKQALTAVESREALAEYLKRQGVTPSDHLVDVEINQEPAFFNQLGEFDQNIFDSRLQAAGLTAQEVKEATRDDVAQKHLVLGMAAGLETPKIYGAVIANYMLESRALSYFVLDPHSVPPPQQPTDAQLQALINAHAADLTRPETRTLSLVRFSAKALAPTMTVDEAKVQSLYQQRVGGLAQPEKRSLTEFATRDAAKAAAIAAALKAGQDPAAVGKAQGVQPIIYDDKPKDGVVDPAVAAAAFSAQSGQVVGPIASGLAGYAVIKITKVTPANTPTLEQVRPQLEADVKTDAAVAKVFDAVKKYQDAHDGGANLADSARAAGATPVTLGPITAQGKDVNNQPVAGATAKLVKEAFALPQGGESEMEDEGDGEYFAIRVEKVTPPTVPSLAEIKPQLAQYFMQQELIQALGARADALIKAIKKGQSFEAAAASANAKTAVAPAITRQALQQSRRLPAEMVEMLFDAKQGEVVAGQVGPVQVMVARIDSVRAPAGDDAAREAAVVANSFNQMLLTDMIDATEALAVTVVKPQGDLAAARQALGLSPEDMPKSGAKPSRGPAP